MSLTSANRWLLPRQQTEFPSRAVLPETIVHRRRESTFLVLTALVFVSMTAMLVLGTSRTIDLAAVVGRIAPDVELPRPMLVPFGALSFAVSLIAIALAGELFGRRRALSLVCVGIVMCGALVGLMHVADLVDGGTAMASTVAFAACFVSAHVCHVIVFDAWHRATHGQRFARVVVTALLASAVGWGVFLFVLQYGGKELGAVPAWDTSVALAIGAAACAAAGVIVLAVPAVLVARVLSIALRVGNDELMTDAEPSDAEPSEPAWTRSAASTTRVFDEPTLGPPPLRRPQAVVIPPYSSAEMRFFADGDNA